MIKIRVNSADLLKHPEDGYDFDPVTVSDSNLGHAMDSNPIHIFDVNAGPVFYSDPIKVSNAAVEVMVFRLSTVLSSELLHVELLEEELLDEELPEEELLDIFVFLPRSKLGVLLVELRSKCGLWSE
ncbi:hypothetical protein EVAR_16541_1 [Eumeta japonica]|uniref:Uncharacterized protein n=1 Tax=Eumeta variegata TaxID=151549 RepID=A0A4C1U326_EUMVA|nr:hypothetical protein EVAR_16541_1 [Eumeta japonica]